MDMEKLRGELIRDEGQKLNAYKDSVGLWTIGVGHLLGTEIRMSRITERESQALLDSDIAESLAVLDKVAPWWKMLSETRQRVMANMAFNLGGRLAQFKNTLAAIADGQYAEASKMMLESKWAWQVGQRAVRLAKMMETDQS